MRMSYVKLSKWRTQKYNTVALKKFDLAQSQKVMFQYSVKINIFLFMFR